MLDKVKLALRLSGTALDGEVSDLINAAIADLRLVGINIPAEAGSSSKTLRWAIPFLIGRLCFMQRRNSASMTTRSVTATHTII
ncbi:MAG: hypothetical protein ACLS5Z_06990 [Clostridium fessum]